MYVVTHAYMYAWTYTGEINSKRIREKYLKAVLRQDVAFFDTLGAGEVATRIQTDTHLIQLGISEKVASKCAHLIPLDHQTLTLGTTSCRQLHCGVFHWLLTCLHPLVAHSAGNQFHLAMHCGTHSGHLTP